MILKEQGDWLSNKFTEASEPLEAQRLLSGGLYLTRLLLYSQIFVIIHWMLR